MKDARWTAENQRYLSCAVAVVRQLLETQSSTLTPEQRHARAHVLQIELEEARAAMSNPPALERLVAAFELSEFERAVLLLAAGVELSSTFAHVCSVVQGDSNRPYATFGLALGALRNGHWSALSPGAPLRKWRFLEVDPGPGLTASPLRIDERILHFLTGVDEPDERLAGVVRPVLEELALVASHQEIAKKLERMLSDASLATTWPIVQLSGEDLPEKRGIALQAARAAGLELFSAPLISFPSSAAELENLIRHWTREWILCRRALLLECDAIEPGDTARMASIGQFCDRMPGALIISTRERQRFSDRAGWTLDIPKPSRIEQADLWIRGLGDDAKSANGMLETLVYQFNLPASSIRSLSAGRPEEDNIPLFDALWDACSARARQRLDDLAERILPAAHWDDLVLPEAQRQILREIVVHVRQRSRVYDSWGFAKKGARGLGISALFSGASGTGKTMAAEVLANELHVDLFRIDLSQVVSKYIGETEKNLRRVFSAAEEGGAILLFDEADALFGKRGEVKDSHDRYANIEVSYLLQQMEAYRGLAILTTNMKEALDSAFLRRIRFAVQFPFPDTSQRAEIWRRIFPTQTPTQDLDFDKLARLNVAGGNIRNVALYAAFLAADSGQAVLMSHLLRAARVEFAKLERPLTDVEIKGWV